ncbi:MAG: RNA polymerase sigma factor, partial [Nitriliruptoraceae bacterium]
MQLATRSDAELVRRAQEGMATAFAALVHRHAPAVRATVASAADPEAAVVATFSSAMRGLDHRDPDEPVAPWFIELASQQVSDPAPVTADAAPPMDPDELDRIWRELDRR